MDFFLEVAAAIPGAGDLRLSRLVKLILDPGGVTQPGEDLFFGQGAVS
jgi:hypothetical protein